VSSSPLSPISKDSSISLSAESSESLISSSVDEDLSLLSFESKSLLSDTSTDESSEDEGFVSEVESDVEELDSVDVLAGSEVVDLSDENVD
jgi:hypothetical protein